MSELLDYRGRPRIAVTGMGIKCPAGTDVESVWATMRAGQSMADVPLQAVEGKPILIDFPLASLAAGEYVIQLDAKAPSGTAQQMIGFKVGS